MKPRKSMPPATLVIGLSILGLLAAGASRCSLLGEITVSPENEVKEIGTYDVIVGWTDEIDSPDFTVSLNGEDISSSLKPIVGKEAAFETGDQFPGKKIAKALVRAKMGGKTWLASNTSIHTATSSLPREAIPAGKYFPVDDQIVFSCQDGFLHLPIDIPGVSDTLDDIVVMVLGFLPMGGNFPAGDTSFPTEPLSIAHGIVVGSSFVPLVTYETIFDADADVSNGISYGPIMVALTEELLGQIYPMTEGMVCGLSFQAVGTLYPVDDPAGTYCAAMSQTLQQLSISVIRDGTCQSLYTSPEGQNILSFNFLAECN